MTTVCAECALATQKGYKPFCVIPIFIDVWSKYTYDKRHASFDLRLVATEEIADICFVRLCTCFHT